MPATAAPSKQQADSYKRIIRMLARVFYERNVPESDPNAPEPRTDIQRRKAKEARAPCHAQLPRGGPPENGSCDKQPYRPVPQCAANNGYAASLRHPPFVIAAGSADCRRYRFATPVVADVMLSLLMIVRSIATCRLRWSAWRS